MTLGNILWSMFVFFFWFMAITLFVMCFADIFRRRDLSGLAKACWTILIFILPLIGVLIYLIARPKMTQQDREELERAQEAQRRMSGYSPADEVAKLAKLHDSGTLSDQEYEEMKRRALLTTS